MCDFDFELNSFLGFCPSKKSQIIFNADSIVTSLMSNDQVKNMFIRYNMTLPSSAPVERLFSSVGLIETPRRNRLTDSISEKLLHLKINKQHVRNCVIQIFENFLYK